MNRKTHLAGRFGHALIVACQDHRPTLSMDGCGQPVLGRVSQQGAGIGQVNQIDKVRPEDFHQALAQQLLVKSPAGQLAEVPVGLAADVSQDARAEEHQQPKTGLPRRLCQPLLGNHGPILRDSTEDTTTPDTTLCGYRGSGRWWPTVSVVIYGCTSEHGSGCVL